MSSPAENTRGAKTAVRLFAEKGLQSTSVRDIVVNARVNQAAIN
jgi:AcrR family transcriptional regulator